REGKEDRSWKKEEALREGKTLYGARYFPNFIHAPIPTDMISILDFFSNHIKSVLLGIKKSPIVITTLIFVILSPPDSVLLYVANPTAPLPDSSVVYLSVCNWT
ncbi:hypothetical protein, partial [Okeania sp. SIO2C9]|uniref:hypothetical protein n=1 Tax=Okeania sp. SIO2C9 TaxID=2607791 RepID=UPI0025CFC25C